MRRLAALALVATLASSPARGEEPPPPAALRLQLPQTLAVTGAALGGTLATLLLKDRLAPHACRICGTSGLDTTVRDSLRWRDTTAASRASDLLQLGVPLLAAGHMLWEGWRAAGWRTAAEDALLVAEPVSVVLLANQVAKYAFGRVRPDAWAQGGRGSGPDAYLSLWSAHTSATFAVATAAATVARLRGYRSWPWILALGLAGAASCGWLRIAADRHWVTDVLAGAAVGSAAGVGLPLWLHRPEEARAAGGLELRLLPGGIAGSF